MRVRISSAIALLVALSSSSAEADDVHGTRFVARERTHAIDARVGRGHAVLVVTRTIENSGPKSDQAMFMLDVPHGSVATRLRTAGTTAAGAPIWFEGELMEAEEAAKKYRELTGIGGYYPKDPALLSWRTQDRLALQVFPVPAGGTKTVEYTMKLPLAYAAGRWTAKLPALGTEAAPARIKLTPMVAGDEIEVNGVPVGGASTVTATREMDVALVPHGAPTVDAALASFGFAKDRVLLHARYAAAPRVAEPPARSSVVVLVDTSRSMADKLDSAYASVASYLGGLAASGSSDVEVLTFARKVHSPFGGPVTARAALSKLYGLSRDTANGSNLDEALKRADARLQASSAPAKRILLVTDLQTREALSAESMAKTTLASGAVLHVATVAWGAPSLTRDDDDAWAALPRKTGGLLWHATIDHAEERRATAVFEEWIRPKRIDRFQLTGMPEGSIEIPTSLEEGAAIESLGVVPTGTAKVTLAGELWSRPWRLEVTPSADEAKLWSALVFGSDVMSELSEKEQMTLAMHGRAVSPVTSYLAIEPGVRPSTEGLDEAEGIGLGSMGSVGHGWGSGHGSISHGSASKVDREKFLRDALEAAMVKCNVTGAVSATIESTSVEIVDVRKVGAVGAVGAAGKHAKNETCMTEELWTLMLPAAFSEAHATWVTTAVR